MKKWLTITGVILALPIVGLAAMSFFSKKSDLGLVEGQLRSCPGTPNCVCSESESGESGIEPLTYTGQAEVAWQRLSTTIEAMGGRIEENDGTYLHATFRSRLFRFVDDLECRLDSENNIIHVRSASRAGQSHLGVNRKRIEKLREEYQKAGIVPGPF